MHNYFFLFSILLAISYNNCTNHSILSKFIFIITFLYFFDLRHQLFSFYKNAQKKQQPYIPNIPYCSNLHQFHLYLSRFFIPALCSCSLFLLFVFCFCFLFFLPGVNLFPVAESRGQSNRFGDIWSNVDMP